MSDELEMSLAQEADAAFLESVPVEETKSNPVEDQARAKGWRPESEFEGNPEDFVSAKEYMRVGEMIDRQKKLERQIEKQLGIINSVAKQNQDMYKKFQDAEVQGYQRAVEELRRDRQEALDVGDTVRADQITDEMNVYKETIKQGEQQAKQSPAWSPEVTEFVERNKSWFGPNPQLTQLAMVRDRELRIRYPGKSEEDILQMVENEFSPEKVENKSSAKPLAAPNRSSDPSVKVKYGINDLSKDEKSIFAGIKQVDPSYTVDKYIQQLKDLGAR